MQTNEHACYFVAYKSSINKDKYFVLGINESILLRYRKLFGIGKIVQNISKHPDIHYIMLQDTIGIFSSSRPVDSINAIFADEFLSTAWDSDSSHIRTLSRENITFLEVVNALTIKNTKFITRIALTLDDVYSISHQSLIRAILTGIAFFIASAFLLSFLFFRKKHQDLQTSSSAILSNISDAVIAIDDNSNILLCNSAAESIFGIKHKSIENMSFKDIFPDDPFGITENIQNTTAVDFKEVTINNKSLGFSLSFISSSNKQSFYMAVIIIRDLSERKLLEQQIHISDKFKAMGKMAGSVAHEIRNPLNAINIIAQRFQYEFTPESDKDEYYKLISTVRSEVKRVNSIITSFLDISRPTKLNLKNADISSILQDTLTLFEQQAKTQHVNISTDFQETIASVDPDKIKQVFINLIKNALEAMPLSGKLYCSSEILENSIQIIIQDSGPGIPAQKADRIFDLYYTDKTNGTGLGLSIVYQILSEHNATIKVESPSNQGAKFIINFPISRS